MKDLLTNATDKVREFHTLFEHPIADVPTLMPYERVQVRGDWIKDECDELVDPAKQTLEDQADATLDIIYFALGNFVEIGLDPTPLLAIVQEANMAKVWPDGTIHKNNDGKTIKPPGWEAPEPKLRAEIARQIARRKEVLQAQGADHTAFFRRGAHAIPAVQAASPTEEPAHFDPLQHWSQHWLTAPGAADALKALHREYDAIMQDVPFVQSDEASLVYSRDTSLLAGDMKLDAARFFHSGTAGLAADEAPAITSSFPILEATVKGIEVVSDTPSDTTSSDAPHQTADWLEADPVDLGSTVLPGEAADVEVEFVPPSSFEQGTQEG
jgi:predicted HAD superfamily Cof-like phosphohydrolase